MKESSLMVKNDAETKETELLISGSRSSHEKKGGWHDILIALAFLFQCAYIIDLACKGRQAALNWSKTDESITIDGVSFTITWFGALVLFTMLLFSGICSVLWTMILVLFSALMLTLTTIILVGLLAYCSYVAFQEQDVFMGYCFAILAVFAALISYSQRHRLRFVAVNMKIASKAIFAHFGMWIVPLVISTIQLVWIFVWIMAVLGAAVKFIPDGTYTEDYLIDAYLVVGSTVERRSTWCWVLMIGSFTWTQQTFTGVVQVTAGAILGKWWYHVKSEDSSLYTPTVLPAFFSALTKNLGSIALGSLLNFIASILRGILSRINSGLSCIIQPMINMLEFFNQYAFACIGIYGLGYLRSGKKVLNLFKECGVTALIADAFLSSALMLSSVLLGILNMYISSELAIPTVNYIQANNSKDFLSEFDEPTIINYAGYAGFFVGMCTSTIFFRTLGGVTEASIVCFVENPHALFHNHPESYTQAHKAWKRVFPHYASGLQATKPGTVILSV